MPSIPLMPAPSRPWLPPQHLANPFASISAAVGTLAGSLHGGANEDVLKMLDEIGDAKNVRGYIENRLQNKQVIMGMGHREYRVKDPRVLRSCKT